MDQGINLPFSSVGIDDATFGMPTFKDGWKGLIITGSSQKALRDNKGGRLLLHVKCVHDPAGADNGKEHLISLNLWHNEQSTKDRAANEMASIIRAVFGSDRQINNTAELYNQPFLAKAVTQKPAPTQEYPNPTDQTNWRGYATQAGMGVGVDGPNGRLGASGGGAMGGGSGGPPNFNQQGQNPNQQPQQQGWGGNPQAGNPQSNQQQQGGGGWGNPNQPQGQPQGQPDQNTGGWGQGGSNAPNGQQGFGAGAPNNAQNGGGQGGWNGGGAPTQSPSNPGGGWGDNNQQQQQNNGGGGGWGPQGGGNPGAGAGWNQ